MTFTVREEKAGLVVAEVKWATLSKSEQASLAQRLEARFAQSALSEKHPRVRFEVLDARALSALQERAPSSALLRSDRHGHPGTPACTRPCTGVSSLIVSTLALAEKQLASKPAAALETLLAVWRTTWHPDVGRLIDRLGDSLPAQPLELPSKQGERAARLAELVRTAPPAERSPVIAAFREFAVSAAGSKVWPSVEAWTTVDPDPRVARMALEVLGADEAVHHFTAKLWRRLMGCIEHHGDAGVVDAAESLAKTLPSGGWGGAYPLRLKNIARKLAAGRAAGEVDAAALARIAQALPEAKAKTATRRAPASSRDADGLLAAICAAPDDDGPRLAYADWLTEHADPRGEFIVLQVARARGKVTAAAKKREDELLRLHRRRFFGRLEAYLKLSSVRFERGFVTKGELTGKVPALPELALLEDVDLRAAKLVKASALKNVRRVRGATPEQAAQLLKVKSLTTLQVVDCSAEQLAGAASSTLEHLELIESHEGAHQRLPALLSARFPALRTATVNCASRPWDGERGQAPMPAMFKADVLRSWRPGLSVTLDMHGVEVTLAHDGAGFAPLHITLGKWGNEYTQARTVAGAIASFVKKPLDVKVVNMKSVDSAKRRALIDKYVAPVRAGARTLKIVG